MNDAKQATREELTRRCGHECLREPNHDGPHLYGYISGPLSYEGLLAEVDRLQAECDQLRARLEAHDDPSGVYLTVQCEGHDDD